VNRKTDIAILPLGATEQHGSHLPFETDTLIAQGIADALARRLAKTSIRAELLPAEPIGYSPEHMDVPGSSMLGYAEAIERWTAIGADCKARGINRFLMLNAHGGNAPLMTIVASELRRHHAMLAVATSWTRFIEPGGRISTDEKAYGIHGGDIETSLMLALYPDKVDMARAADFPSLQQHLAGRYQYLRAYGQHAFGWMMSDLNPHGVAGNAASATAQKGHELIDQAADGLVRLVHEIVDFQPPFLDGP
jgi:creatinine amidohydrolase